MTNNNSESRNTQQQLNFKPVQYLAITFLVDNSIEWMTKLPSGFTHEMRHHLNHKATEVDPLTGVPILSLEDFCCAAHGFSALIETHETAESTPRFTLFDTGPESKSLSRNLAGLGTPLVPIECIVISHWHADHTGGLLSFLDLRGKDTSPRTVIDVHPDQPTARGIAPPPSDKVICQLPRDPTFEEIVAHGGVVEKHNEGHAITGGAVWISGEIPRVTPFETGLIGGMRFTPNEDGTSGSWIKEQDIMDERYAAVDVLGKGLVIFSACSHAGIVNVVKDAVERFSRPIYMIVGGLHLAGPELADRIKPTVDFLSKDLIPSPTYVLPMHCTGFSAKIALEAALGEGCVPAGVGHKVVIKGVPNDDASLRPPSIRSC
ncbi:metallo-beta-lactamase protein [Multifurca ochricompacta]|uniref:Metallo-beta-lactamase protein n=1 Tax=Multifurca ochricompacta TaxID=376703 RepID=A0AAD4QN75_9AGAM|nr:metallo-beta-lactamase protein [Multifurca ochricompacta]